MTTSTFGGESLIGESSMGVTDGDGGTRVAAAGRDTEKSPNSSDAEGAAVGRDVEEKSPDSSDAKGAAVGRDVEGVAIGRSEDTSDASGMALLGTSVAVRGAEDAEDGMSKLSYMEGILVPLVTGRGRGAQDSSRVPFDSNRRKRGGDDMKGALVAAGFPS